MPNLLDAAVLTVLLPVSAANTAAATSTGIDLTDYEGVITIVQALGAGTGSLFGKVQGSTDNSVWNDLTGAQTGTIPSPGFNTTNLLSLHVDNVRTSVGLCRYIRYVGTITTGPVLVGVALIGFKKQAP